MQYKIINIVDENHIDSQHEESINWKSRGYSEIPENHDEDESD